MQAKGTPNSRLREEGIGAAGLRRFRPPYLLSPCAGADRGHDSHGARVPQQSDALGGSLVTHAAPCWTPRRPADANGAEPQLPQFVCPRERRAVPTASRAPLWVRRRDRSPRIEPDPDELDEAKARAVVSDREPHCLVRGEARSSRAGDRGDAVVSEDPTGIGFAALC